MLDLLDEFGSNHTQYLLLFPCFLTGLASESSVGEARKVYYVDIYLYAVWKRVVCFELSPVYLVIWDNGGKTAALGLCGLCASKIPR